MLITIKYNFLNYFTLQTIVLFDTFLVQLYFDNLILDFILLWLFYVHECYMLKESQVSEISLQEE